MTTYKNKLAILAMLLALIATPIVPTISANAQVATGITVNNVQTTSGTVSTAPYQLTLSNFNVGSSSNTLLVVGVEANSQAVTSITYGGVQLTHAVSSFNNNDAEFWYLANPSSSGNIVVIMGGSTSAVVGAYSLSGIDLANPIPTSVKNSNSVAGMPSVSITTQYPNSMVLDLPSMYGGVTLGSPTCTQQWNVNVLSAITGASSSTTVQSPGSVTCSWTASGGGDMWDDVAIEVKASGSASGSNGGASGGSTCNSQTEITSNFNGNSISGGNFIWFNSVMKLTSPIPSSGLTVHFTGQTITSDDFTISVPNSEIIFSWSATTATTTFDTVNNQWVTTVPASFGDNVFLSGVAYQVPASGLPGGINPVSWSGQVSSSSAMSMNWQWGAAVYTTFSTDYNSLGVKPVHSTSLDNYPNGDQAGTPENFKSYVIGGARGGGGSNWTGSYSGTASASSSCPGFTLLVNAQTTTGSPISVNSTISQGGTPISQGMTPIESSVVSGQSYQVSVQNTPTCQFVDWLDTGASDNPRTVQISGDTTITAVFNCTTSGGGGGTSNLTVSTTECPCAPGNFGLILSQNGQVVATGSGTTTFHLNNGQNYTLTAQDSPGWTFAFWSDTGSTDRNRTISVTSDTTITACYRIAS